MVTLSVVVPVHAVERYLVQCLDSIRAGLTAAENASVEVIAIDDASPDRSGAMLDAYPGIKVVHLPQNVGLGLARNAGLAAATGDYVWFVDSDDWLPAGSVSAVLGTLAQSRPDVLLVDHLRAHEDGRMEVDASSPLLAGPVTTERMLGVQHTAWNRIVSRDFLLRNDLRFGPGWYEDVPFSHPVVLAADRLAVLNRVCYHYRIGRPGAITSTRSDRHFEAFEQYDNLQQWMGTREVDPALKIKLFSLMISHLLVVVGNEGRMHPSRRRPFFHRLAELYRRHRPAGYAAPSGSKGLKHRLVALDSYPLYALLRLGYRVSRGTERPPLVSTEVPYSIPRPQPASIL
ncbi:glycosyltransferase [Actinoplanes sp. NPDC051411]|uniref:glycosyltransferase family 2 protein n=1 Tax=Actinoplanes sp. NPDC051411 TaxID=3155522 RepID=UPI003443A3DD